MDAASSAAGAAAGDFKPAPARLASTLVVLRDTADGPQVLLQRRAERGDLNSGVWAFPGGVVESGDAALSACCDGVDAAAANERLGLSAKAAPDALAYHVAAVRECFEECGLLIARRAAGDEAAASTEGADRAPLLAPDTGQRERLAGWRLPLHRGERTLAQLCEAEGLRLALDQLVYFDHWLTPLGRPKRFDTRFFAVVLPPAAQEPVADETETVELRWLTPDEALREANALKLLPPQRVTLQRLAACRSAAEFIDWARGRDAVPCSMPRMGSGAQGLRPVLPQEWAWDELGLIDPTDRGSGCYDIQVDKPVRLTPRVIRITADNGSKMTGPGTNTYLVGDPQRNEWAVIDPGPALEVHVDAIIAAAPGPLRWIFVTHTHVDHSPATAALAARTGARVHGRLPAHPQWQDMSFRPDIELAGGERFELGAEPGSEGAPGLTLEAIHTPGHASNHLCFLLHEDGMLFTGDHVMQGSTVVINPPDGDMAVYLDALRRVAADGRVRWLAPGHGFVMADPRRRIEALIAHRLRREAKVLQALRDAGSDGADLDALLRRVYDDAPAALLPVARRSLHAHLIKLRDDGLADERDDHWRARQREGRS